MQIHCLIVDDEQFARKLLVDYAEKIPYLTISGQARNAMEAMQLLQTVPVDLMFLDIQMPDLTGIEFLKNIPRRPVVIFTTAYKEYALEGYSLDVVDYLLKPIAFERFVQGVAKATELIRLKSGRQETSHPALTASTSPLPSPEQSSTLILKADHKLYKVKTDDILFIEGLKEYVTFHTASRRYVVLESLQRLESTLPDYFIRVHKSFIVNSRYVQALNGNLIELGNHRIPIGKSYTEKVKEKLFG